MKKNQRCIVGTFLLLALLIAFAVPAFAATQRVISLPAGRAWRAMGVETRTGDYSYVHAENLSVFPSSGTDNLEYIHCRVLTSSGTRLSESEYIELDEKDAGYTEIQLRDGYLTNLEIIFEFRATTTSPATAVVSYYPL